MTGLSPLTTYAVAVYRYAGTAAPSINYQQNAAQTASDTTIAAGSVMCAAKSATLVGVALPVLALGVPILDTLFSILRRVIERRSIFAPDQGHIHHRLLAKGLRHRWVVVLVYAVTLVVTGLGTIMFVTHGAVPLLIFCSVMTLLVVAFWVAGSMRFSEMMVRLRRNLAIRREAKRQTRRFEEAMLHFREAVSFDGWWQSVCTAAQQMDFAALRMAPQHADGLVDALFWSHPEPVADTSRMAHMTVPVSPACDGAGTLQIECAVPVSDSLELAARRMMLFSRLVEEHSLADLPAASLPAYITVPERESVGGRATGGPASAVAAP